MLRSPLFVPFLSYALLMTFTPGPNNISASVLGSRQGYRRSLPYIFGMSSGFFLVMLGGGFLTRFLTTNYAVIAPYLKWSGVVYMIFLAVTLFLPSKKSEAALQRVGFPGGFILQFLNPKGILFGVTIYTSFATILTGSPSANIGSALFLTALLFAATSTWAIVGKALAQAFQNRVFSLVFNLVMAALLAYSMVSIILH